MYNTVKHTRQWHSQVAFSFERIFGKAARSLFFWDVFFPFEKETNSEAQDLTASGFCKG